MKKILFTFGIIFFTLFANSTQAQLVSCNSTGSEINTFYANETIYVKSTANITVNETSVDIYIVANNNSWINGSSLTDVSGGKKTNTTNSTGYLEIIKIWSPTLNVGLYDIVVDVDKNGLYNSTMDYVDSLTTTGFEVLTTPVPTLALSLGPNNPSNHNWNLGNYSYNTMLQLKLVTGLYEDIKITSMSLAAGGTGNDKDGVQIIYLFSDDNGNSAFDQGENILSFGQYGRDDGLLMLNIENGYTIAANKTSYIIMVYTMTNSSSNGNTYSFQIASLTAEGVGSGLKVTPTGFPINSAVKTVVGATTTTTTVETTTTLVSSTTTTTIPTTTTTSPPSSPLGIDWIYIILIAGLVPVAILVIVLAYLFFKRKRSYRNTFDELKDKWKKY